MTHPTLLRSTKPYKGGTIPWHTLTKSGKIFFMTTPLIAAIDIGTTSTRAILFDRQGGEVATHQIEYSTSAQSASKRGSPQIFSAEGVAISLSENLILEDMDTVGPTLRFPRPGWVECRPSHILANAVQCLAACLTMLDAKNSVLVSEGKLPYKVISIGVTNMRETTLVWSEKTGKPLYHGIVWNDTRNSQLVSEINNNTPKDILDRMLEKCGCPVSTYFSSTKWMWLYNNIPEVREAYDSGERDIMFGTVDTWLIYNLTREKAFVTDVTNAARTNFMSLDTKDYDEELLDFWKIDREKIQLPKIVSSSEVYGYFQVPDLQKVGYCEGTLSQEALAALDTVKDVPIAGCLGDQSSSLVGNLAVKRGNAKCTFGTGAFLLYNLGHQKLISQNGALTTFGYWFPHLDESVDGEFCNEAQYALEGSIAVAGSVVQWLRDNLKLINHAQDIGPLASQVDNSGGVVFVPCFSGLFAPYWDSESRGTIFGLTQYTSSSHIARAALEGVCYQTRAILRAMVSDAGSSTDFLDDSTASHANPLSLLFVDGGMSKSNEVMQIQADILGPCVTVKRSLNSECTALGAAIAAGLAGETPETRMWSSLTEALAEINKRAEAAQAVNARKIIKDVNEFVAEVSDEDRRHHWKMWERAIEKAKHWLAD